MMARTVYCRFRPTAVADKVQRRMELFMTVPLLLPMILLETELPAGKLKAKAWTVGLGSVLMIALAIRSGH